MPPPKRKKELNGTSRLSNRKKTIPDHPANLSDYQEGGFYKIPVEVIKPNPHQPRQYFSQKLLKKLSFSIKENGMIQPLALQKDEKGDIIILAGERRLRAAKLAGFFEVPAVFIGGNPAEIALIENIQRANLNPIEEAAAYGNMIKEHGYTQDKLSKIVGKARNTITETLSINKLPETIKTLCLHSDIYPKNFLVRVARQKTDKGMQSFFTKGRSSYENKNENKEKTERKRDTPLEIAVKRIVGLQVYIEKLNMNSFSEKEKDEIIKRAKELQDSLVKILPK